jgi:hypothetical protein
MTGWSTSPRLPTVSMPPMVGGRHDSGPCDCPAYDDAYGHHAAADHDRGSCGGISHPEPCGGCWDCLAAQAIHAYRLAGLRCPRPWPPMLATTNPHDPPTPHEAHHR